MSVKTILVAHQMPSVRDRFAAALAEARHASVAAATASELRAVLADQTTRVDLALVDLGLSDAPMELVAEVRRGSDR